MNQDREPDVRQGEKNEVHVPAVEAKLAENEKQTKPFESAVSLFQYQIQK